MRVGRRSVLAPALAGMSLALAGCGANAHDQVQAKVKQLAQATASKDYRTLCGEVLAPSLLARLSSTGVSCVQAMQIALSAVRNPVLSIGRITVSGSTAAAITLTGALGQQGSVDEIVLVKTAQGWRVESLGSPATGQVLVSGK